MVHSSRELCRPGRSEVLYSCQTCYERADGAGEAEVGVGTSWADFDLYLGLGVGLSLRVKVGVAGQKRFLGIFL